MSAALKEEKPEGKDLLADLQDISDSERKTSTAESSIGNIIHTWKNLQTAYARTSLNISSTSTSTSCLNYCSPYSCMTPLTHGGMRIIFYLWISRSEVLQECTGSNTIHSSPASASGSEDEEDDDDEEESSSQSEGEEEEEEEEGESVSGSGRSEQSAGKNVCDYPVTVTGSILQHHSLTQRLPPFQRMSVRTNSLTRTLKRRGRTEITYLQVSELLM